MSDSPPVRFPIALAGIVAETGDDNTVWWDVFPDDPDAPSLGYYLAAAAGGCIHVTLTLTSAPPELCACGHPRYTHRSGPRGAPPATRHCPQHFGCGCTGFSPAELAPAPP